MKSFSWDTMFLLNAQIKSKYITTDRQKIDLAKREAI